jgi:hypothetical protein
MQSLPRNGLPSSLFNVTLRDSILSCGTLATSPHLPHQTLASHFMGKCRWLLSYECFRISHLSSRHFPLGNYVKEQCNHPTPVSYPAQPSSLKKSIRRRTPQCKLRTSFGSRTSAFTPRTWSRPGWFRSGSWIPRQHIKSYAHRRPVRPPAYGPRLKHPTLSQILPETR